MRRKIALNSTQDPSCSVGNHSAFHAVKDKRGKNSAIKRKLRQVYRIFLMIQLEKHIPWISADAKLTASSVHSMVREICMWPNMVQKNRYSTMAPV